MSTQRRMHLEIYGTVQGVAFRAHTQRKARQLNLRGWVRNRSDGSVELVAEGPDSALRQLELWCHEGPAHANVKEVKTRWLDPVGDLEDFATRFH